MIQENEILTRDYGTTEPTELAGHIFTLIMNATLKNIKIYLKAIEEPGLTLFSLSVFLSFISLSVFLFLSFSFNVFCLNYQGLIKQIVSGEDFVGPFERYLKTSDSPHYYR